MIELVNDQGHAVYVSPADNARAAAAQVLHTMYAELFELFDKSLEEEGLSGYWSPEARELVLIGPNGSITRIGFSIMPDELRAAVERVDRFAADEAKRITAELEAEAGRTKQEGGQ